jgi:hypothetical protein
VDRAATSCFSSLAAWRPAFFVNGAAAWPAPATRPAIASVTACGPEALLVRDPFVRFAIEFSLLIVRGA